MYNKRVAPHHAGCEAQRAQLVHVRLAIPDHLINLHRQMMNSYLHAVTVTMCQITQRFTGRTEGHTLQQRQILWQPHQDVSILSQHGWISTSKMSKTLQNDNNVKCALMSIGLNPFLPLCWYTVLGQTSDNCDSSQRRLGTVRRGTSCCMRLSRSEWSVSHFTYIPLSGLRVYHANSLKSLYIQWRTSCCMRLSTSGLLVTSGGVPPAACVAGRQVCR